MLVSFIPHYSGQKNETKCSGGDIANDRDFLSSNIDRDLSFLKLITNASPISIVLITFSLTNQFCRLSVQKN